MLKAELKKELEILGTGTQLIAELKKEYHFD